MPTIVFALTLLGFLLGAVGFASTGWEASRERLRYTALFSYVMSLVMACLAVLVIQLAWF